MFVNLISTSLLRDSAKDELKLKEHDRLPTILLWTQFFSTNWNDPILEYEKRCPVKCNLTSNRTRAQTSGALLFHGLDFTTNDMAKVQYPNQKFVMYTMASEMGTVDMINYNFTIASHRRDSGIYMPYGHLAKRNHSRHGQMKAVNYESKTQSIAWFVSHCITSSKREDYVLELQKYIDVDIYGPCGPYWCPKIMANQCYEMVEQSYKFYLSFENDITRDYVTEKFFLPLRYNVIPIVMGGANYSSIAPKSSYINVNDYASPKDLARYLTTIDKYDYMERMKWKNDYVSEFWPNTIICEVCKLLHV